MMNLKNRSYIYSIVALCLFFGIANAEEVKVTTYYPSPEGEYKTLTTTDNTNLAINSGNVVIGALNGATPHPLTVLKNGLSITGGLLSTAAFDKADFSKGILLGYTATNYVGVVAADSPSDSTASELAFMTRPGTSAGMVEQVRIDNNGLVGIGTTNPDVPLTVLKDSTNTLQNVSTAHAVAVFDDTAYNNGMILGYDTSGGTDTTGGQIATGVIAADIGTGTTSSNIAFFTVNKAAGVGNFTERLRIRYDGNVAIGTTNSSKMTDPLTILKDGNDHGGQGWASVGTFDNTANDRGILLGYYKTGSPGVGIVAADSSSTIGAGSVTSDLVFMAVLGGTGMVERVRIAGATGNVGIGETNPTTYKLKLNGQPGANGYTAWSNYSDIRLKENITDLISDGSSALTKIKQLRPVTFNYNALTDYDAKTRARRISGFIAQEIKLIFPEMVGETQINGKTYLDTNLSDLQLYLVEATKELAGRVEDLFKNFLSHDKKIQALEQKSLEQQKEIKVLQARLTELEAGRKK